jgi:hypothetical protein
LILSGNGTADCYDCRMNQNDPAFSRRIVSIRCVPVPLFIATVGDAIDEVARLPEGIAALQHWQLARDFLCEALEHPNDAAVSLAEAAFLAALKKQRWLM